MTNSVKDVQNVESASATTLKELKDTLWTVSYTHLTLPTICSV